MPTFTATLFGAAPLYLLACAAVVGLPVSVGRRTLYISPFLYPASAAGGSKMSRSAAGGSPAGRAQTGGGGEQHLRPESGGGGGLGPWGGFPLFTPPLALPTLHTLDRLYAEMVDNMERMRAEMERLYYPALGVTQPYLALGAGPSSPALRAGASSMPLALPGAGGRAGGTNHIMPYYRHGRTPTYDMMSPLYSPMVGGGAVMPFTRGLGSVVPRVDFQELENEYLVQADVPGIDKSNIKIQVHNGILHINAEQQQESHEQHKGYFMQERHQSSFSRSLPLPENVREDEIRATMKDGVLQVHMPKIPSEKSNIKKIHVE